MLFSDPSKFEEPKKYTVLYGHLFPNSSKISVDSK